MVRRPDAFGSKKSDLRTKNNGWALGSAFLLLTSYFVLFAAGVFSTVFAACMTVFFMRFSPAQ